MPAGGRDPVTGVLLPDPVKFPNGTARADDLGLLNVLNRDLRKLHAIPLQFTRRTGCAR